jgi:DNA-binding Lrp family transcriptional regulator
LTEFIKKYKIVDNNFNRNMRLSTKSRYGVRAIFDIAYHSEGLETQVKDISRRQEISPRYIEQIFQKLKRAGIIDSKKGIVNGKVPKILDGALPKSEKCG